MVNKSDKIYIAGHNGMVGSACWRALTNKGYTNLVGKSSSELDLRNQMAVQEFINEVKPVVIIDAAARVGGIMANATFPYEFLIENLLIQNNLMSSAHTFDVSKFIFLGSSCIYPKFAKQPIREDYLLSGPLESTNEWYALAKITGVKLIEALRKEYQRDYVALMPTNLYGVNDNFNLQTSHVLPALIRKFHEAKESGNIPVELWGTGVAMREFLFVDDLAEAVVFAVENTLVDDLYNIGSGHEISIKDLALKIQAIIGHTGEIMWDESKPDGTPRKVLDSSKFQQTGWKAKIELNEGIDIVYKWFLNASKHG